jgi:hypothetical protein
MTKFVMYRVNDVPMCADGCCHSGGFMLEKFVDGNLVDGEFFNIEPEWISADLEAMLSFVLGDENVEFVRD